MSSTGRNGGPSCSILEKKFRNRKLTDIDLETFEVLADQLFLGFLCVPIIVKVHEGVGTLNVYNISCSLAGK